MAEKLKITEIFAKVADSLNAKGILPMVGRKWTTANVHDIYYNMERRKSNPAVMQELANYKAHFKKKRNLSI